jgi:hypothetical protein
MGARSFMEWLEIVGVLVIWSVLQGWVLPRFGVPT